MLPPPVVPLLLPSLLIALLLPVPTLSAVGAYSGTTYDSVPGAFLQEWKSILCSELVLFSRHMQSDHAYLRFSFLAICICILTRDTVVVMIAANAAAVSSLSCVLVFNAGVITTFLVGFGLMLSLLRPLLFAIAGLLVRVLKKPPTSNAPKKLVRDGQLPRAAAARWFRTAALLIILLPPHMLFVTRTPLLILRVALLVLLRPRSSVPSRPMFSRPLTWFQSCITSPGLSLLLRVFHLLDAVTAGLDRVLRFGCLLALTTVVNAWPPGWSGSCFGHCWCAACCFG